MSGATFGDMVAEARAVLGMSTIGAAGKLGMTESLLEDIERGLIPLNPQLQVVFEECYGIDLSFLGDETGEREHVARREMTYDAKEGILRIDDLGVRFRIGVDDNDVLFRGYSAAIRRLRRLSPSVPLRLRTTDMPMLAMLADLDDPELDDRARFWFGQDPANVQSFSVLLRLSRPPDSADRAKAA